VKLEQTEDGVTLRAMTDSKGRVVFDLRCPVACGVCCGYWKEVLLLACAQAGPELPEECPHLSGTGCRLPRKSRPLVCLTYLCELGILAIEGRVTQADIDRVLEQEKQAGAFSFLENYPPVVQGKKMKFRKKDRKLIKKIKKEGASYV
jgi:hypothetical protein